MANIIKIAYHIPSQEFVHVDNVSNGLSCNCECIKCNEKLEAVQGYVRTKHFRHHTNINCEGSQETALHELAKQILVNNSQIKLPKFGIINYSEAASEKQLESKRPDVSAIFEGQKIFFEIFVSHAVDSEKDSFFINGKHKSIEIDLSNCLTSNFEEIEKLVLSETSNKRLIFWEVESAPTTSENWWDKLVFILIAVAAFAGLVSLFSQSAKDNCKK